MKIGKQSYISEPLDYKDAHVIVGNYSSISEGFYPHYNLNHPSVENRSLVSNYPFGTRWGLDEYNFPLGDGMITIGNDVWIGREVKVMDGINIGDGAIIAAYSVVTKDVPPYAMVAGNPAIIKYFRFSTEEIRKLEQIKWWDWDEETIKQRMSAFKDVDTFIDNYEK